MGNGSPRLRTIRALGVALLGCAALAHVQPARADTLLPPATAVAAVTQAAAPVVEQVSAAVAETPAAIPAPVAAPAPVATPAPVAAPAPVVALPDLPAPTVAPVVHVATPTAPSAAPRAVAPLPQAARPHSTAPGRHAAPAPEPRRAQTKARPQVSHDRVLPVARRAVAGHHPAGAAPTPSTVAAAAPPARQGSTRIGPPRHPAQDDSSSPGAVPGSPPASPPPGAATAPVAGATTPFVFSAPRATTGSWPEGSSFHTGRVALAFERPG